MSVLRTGMLAGRALLRARYCGKQFTLQYRMTASSRLLKTENTLHLRYQIILSHVRQPSALQIVVRHQSGGGNPDRKRLSKRQKVTKRILMFLASFLIIHYLAVYLWDKRKAKMGRLAPFKIETIFDSDLNRRFTVINGYLLPDFINSRCYNDIYNFMVHPNDVYVVSFPKSGTCKQS